MTQQNRNPAFEARFLGARRRFVHTVYINKKISQPRLVFFPRYFRHKIIAVFTQKPPLYTERFCRMLSHPVRLPPNITSGLGTRETLLEFTKLSVNSLGTVP